MGGRGLMMAELGASELNLSTASSLMRGNIELVEHYYPQLELCSRHVLCVSVYLNDRSSRGSSTIQISTVFAMASARVHGLGSFSPIWPFGRCLRKPSASEW